MGSQNRRSMLSNGRKIERIDWFYSGCMEDEASDTQHLSSNDGKSPIRKPWQKRKSNKGLKQSFESANETNGRKLQNSMCCLMTELILGDLVG